MGRPPSTATIRRAQRRPTPQSESLKQASPASGLHAPETQRHRARLMAAGILKGVGAKRRYRYRYRAVWTAVGKKKETPTLKKNRFSISF